MLTIAAYKQIHSQSWLACCERRQPLGAVLHSSGELSSDLHHDDSTINIVPYYYYYYYYYYYCCYIQMLVVSGDFVGDDDIDSSPTFELIVEGEEAEEVEQESRCTTTMTSSAAETADVTAFTSKRLRMNDTGIMNVTPLSEDK